VASNEVCSKAPLLADALAEGFGSPRGGAGFTEGGVPWVNDDVLIHVGDICALVDAMESSRIISLFFGFNAAGKTPTTVVF
jgi:hypothetical protein